MSGSVAVGVAAARVTDVSPMASVANMSSAITRATTRCQWRLAVCPCDRVHAMAGGPGAELATAKSILRCQGS